MLFNSFRFLVFFPVVVLVYFLIPRRIRYLWLLIASYYFYMCWNAKYAVLLFFSTVVTWCSGLMLSAIPRKAWNEERILFFKKLCVAGSFGLNLTILFLFKYFYFVLESFNFVLEKVQLQIPTPAFDIVLPVGISFYTFQALSYTMDVYREKIAAEKNFLRYALFVSFFPQLVAGPIERSENLLTQLESVDRIRLWDYERVRSGILLMMWGLFQKLVIADRIAIVVDQVYGNYQEYGCVELLTTAVLFSFQIYCDFGGYSNIAKGTAEVLGITLINNFRQPYLAADIREFWRRWHISLTSWFTDYLYIPLGGNRKGRVKQCRNILLVFLCSGLWHGANWTYVLWGLMHGCLQVCGSIGRWAEPKKQRKMGIAARVIKTGGTFLTVTICWIFFRADTIGQAFGYLAQCMKYPRLQTFFKMGLSRAHWIVLLMALAVLCGVDLLHERGVAIRKSVCESSFIVRGIVYLGGIWAIILFGIYGYQYDASQFIYFQF